MSEPKPTDLIEVQPLGKFRWHTPNLEFCPEVLQQLHRGKTRDGLSGEFWITGTIDTSSGLFVPTETITSG